MKQVAKNILTALMGAAILAGCSTDEQDEILSCQKSKLGIKVNTFVPNSTRSIFEDAKFPSGKEIGVCMTNSDGENYDSQTSYGNVRWTARDVSGSQIWESDKEMLLSATEAYVYAYYPYSSAVTDITAIPVTAAEQKDYMYANSVKNVNNQNNEATLVMNHALSAIRLSLVKGNYTGAGFVTAVKVKGTPIATSAEMDAKTGKLNNITGTNTNIELVKSLNLQTAAQDIDIIAIPTGNSGAVTITLTIDGKDYNVLTTDITCYKGQIYKYTLTVNSTSLDAGGVTVGEWGYNQNGDMEVNLGYKVTIGGDMSEIALQNTLSSNSLTIKAVSLTYGKMVKAVNYTGTASITQSESDGVRTITVSDLATNVTITFNGVGYYFLLDGDQTDMSITKTVSDDGTTATVIATPTTTGMMVKKVTGSGTGTLTQSVDEVTGVRTINVTDIASDYTVTFAGVGGMWKDLPNGIYYVDSDFYKAESASSSCKGVVLIADGHKFMIEKNETANNSYKNALGGGTLFYWGEAGTDQSGIPSHTSAHSSNSNGYIPNESGSWSNTPQISGDISTWIDGSLGDWNGKSNSGVLKGVTTSGSEDYNSYATIGKLLKSFNTSFSDNCGKSDWYIPSCGQLALMYRYMTSINNALAAIGGTKLASGRYWSSSEWGDHHGWFVDFYNGYVSAVGKGAGNRVRFIRDLN